MANKDCFGDDSTLVFGKDLQLICRCLPDEIHWLGESKVEMVGRIRLCQGVKNPFEQVKDGRKGTFRIHGTYDPKVKDGIVVNIA